ncbi:MAG: hypothetical protein RR393_07910 [Bacteroidales bacterium]
MKENLIEIKTDPELKGKSIRELRSIALTIYKNKLNGKEVINKDIGIKILFTVSGGRKTTQGSAMYSKKVAVIPCLLELLKNAEYSNFGSRKTKDTKDILGYLNFKVKCIIDGKKETLRIAVRMVKRSRFYYNMEINTIVAFEKK